jgi:hypothetical protein
MYFVRITTDVLDAHILFADFEFVHHRCVYQLDLLCDSIIYYI